MDNSAAGSSAGDLRRIANLLALLVVKDESETDKVTILAAAGFSSTEIAALLRKQPNNVSVLLYQAKKAARVRTGASNATGKSGRSRK